MSAALRERSVEIQLQLCESLEGVQDLTRARHSIALPQTSRENWQRRNAPRGCRLAWAGC